MQFRTRWMAALCAAVAAVYVRPAAAQDEVRFSGYTNGCFSPVGGPVCTPTIASGFQPGVSTGGAGGGALTYYNASFDEWTVLSFLALGGNPRADGTNFNNLGAFGLDLPATGAGTAFDGMGFTLAVTFTNPVPLNPMQPQPLPPGASPVPIDGNTISFTALLRGTVRSNGTGGVSVDFGNNALNFFSVDTDTGPDDNDFVFAFLLSDVNVNPQVAPASVTGNIQAVGGIFPTAVPEPSTYALLATGLAGVALTGVRRRARR